MVSKMRNQLIKMFCLLGASLCITACGNTNNQPVDPPPNYKKTAEINIKLGMAYLARGDMQRSKQKFLLAIDQAPELPEVWYSMAYFLEKTHEIKEADKFYLKAVSIAPTRGDVQNNYGTFLCRTGNYRAAISHFMLAVNNTDYLDTASAAENAGLCALKIPNRHLAKTYFQRALAQDSTRIVSKEELAKLNLRV